MSQEEKKRADAMRIFEALSGVDEELLVRCEKESTVVPMKRRKYPLRYYGSVIAACLCLMIVGVAVWNNGVSWFTVKDTQGTPASSVVGEEKEAVKELAAGKDEKSGKPGENGETSKAPDVPRQEADEKKPEAIPGEAVKEEIPLEKSDSQSEDAPSEQSSSQPPDTTLEQSGNQLEDATSEQSGNQPEDTTPEQTGNQLENTTPEQPGNQPEDTTPEQPDKQPEDGAGDGGGYIPSTEGDDTPGQEENPGEGENPGQEGDPGQGEFPGAGEEPGAGESPEQGEIPGAGEEPGAGESPGQGDAPGQGETPGAGGNPGEGENPDEGENPGQGGNPGQGDWPGFGEGNDAGSPGDDGMIGAPAFTLEQAWAVEGLGAYVPRNLPGDYVLDGINVLTNAETGTCEQITLMLYRGEDSMFVTISYKDGSTITLTDASKPETYNVHLYGDAVPEEYVNTMLEPIFAAEDLSLDIVKMRMISRDGVRTTLGNFSVYYNGGVLVEFDGYGEAESIYAMFEGLGS